MALRHSLYSQKLHLRCLIWFYIHLSAEFLKIFRTIIKISSENQDGFWIKDMFRIKSRVKKEEQKIIQKLVVAKHMNTESLKPRIGLKRKTQSFLA